MPEVFAPGLISLDDARELNAVFSPDMRIFMFTREIDGVFKIHYTYQLEPGSAHGRCDQLSGHRLVPGGHARRQVPLLLSRR